jgi:hypothetical protein
MEKWLDYEQIRYSKLGKTTQALAMISAVENAEGCTRKTIKLCTFHWFSTIRVET